MTKVSVSMRCGNIYIYTTPVRDYSILDRQAALIEAFEKETHQSLVDALAAVARRKAHQALADTLGAVTTAMASDTPALTDTGTGGKSAGNPATLDSYQATLARFRATLDDTQATLAALERYRATLNTPLQAQLTKIRRIRGRARKVNAARARLAQLRAGGHLTQYLGAMLVE